MPIEYHSKYLHHHNQVNVALIREVVFGMEDGMVSTLGAITGIAVGTQNPFTVILAGLVIIAVESIAMAVGAYLSIKSGKEIDERKLVEEREEITEFPEEEKNELFEMYVKDGWPEGMAREMVTAAAEKPTLLLKEMAYRELSIVPDRLEKPLHNALAMGISYVIGGSIPLVAYFFLPLSSAIPLSIVVTLGGLFCLGVATTKYSKRKWWKAGLEMLGLASAAAVIGYIVGRIVNSLWLAG